jgi:hypothetical protein
LGTGQRLAIFVQQQNRISVLWTRAFWLATGLVVVGVVFLGTNSYALYWTLRQQRGSSGKSKDSSQRRVDQGPTGSSIAPSGSSIAPSGSKGPGHG